MQHSVKQLVVLIITKVHYRIALLLRCCHVDLPQSGLCWNIKELFVRLTSLCFISWLHSEVYAFLLIQTAGWF